MKRMRGLVLIALFALSCCIMVGCGYDEKRGFSSDSPEEVAEQFIDSIKDLDFESARKLCKGKALSDINKMDSELKKIPSGYRDETKKLLKRQFSRQFSGVRVKSKSKTDSFWAGGDNSCKVTVTTDDVDEYIELKRDNVFSPWYIVNID